VASVSRRKICRVAAQNVWAHYLMIVSIKGPIKGSASTQDWIFSITRSSVFPVPDPRKKKKKKEVTKDNSSALGSVLR